MLVTFAPAAIVPEVIDTTGADNLQALCAWACVRACLPSWDLETPANSAVRRGGRCVHRHRMLGACVGPPALDYPTTCELCGGAHATESIS